MKRLAGWQLVRAATESEDSFAGSQQVVADDPWVADGYFSRLIGWQFRAPPPRGQGLLLVPCRAVHTCWLRFPLHLVFLDRSGHVVAVRERVVPWRLVARQAAAHAVLELPGSGEPLPLRPGDQLRLVPRGGEGESPPLPRSVRFLVG